MTVELRITGETSGEVMDQVRNLASATQKTAPPDPEPATFDPELEQRVQPEPEPEPEPEPTKQSAKKAPAKKAPAKKGNGAAKKTEPEPEPEPDEPVTFEHLTEAATAFIESLDGDMRKAQDAVQTQFGVRRISQLEQEQWAAAYQWLRDQVGDK